MIKEISKWVLVEKKTIGHKLLPTNSVSIRKNSLTISKDLGKNIKTKKVEIFLNASDGKLGLRPTFDESKGFCFREKFNAMSVGSKRLGIPQGKYKAVWSESNNSVIVDLEKGY